MFVQRVPSSSSTPSLKCNSVKNSNSQTNIYKSVRKNFIINTKIKETKNQVFVVRNIIWYDSKKKTYRKKREVQAYHCDDFCETIEDINTDDNEFDF